MCVTVKDQPAEIHSAGSSHRGLINRPCLSELRKKLGKETRKKTSGGKFKRWMTVPSHIHADSLEPRH